MSHPSQDAWIKVDNIEDCLFLFSRIPLGMRGLKEISNVLDNIYPRSHPVRDAWIKGMRYITFVYCSSSRIPRGTHGQKSVAKVGASYCKMSHFYKECVD